MTSRKRLRVVTIVCVSLLAVGIAAFVGIYVGLFASGSDKTSQADEETEYPSK